MARRNVGRVRIRLAAQLTEALQDVYPGAVIEPEDLWMQEGAYRSRYWDLARWGYLKAIEARDGDGAKVYPILNLYSWSTMSDCLAYGFGFGCDKRDGPHTFVVESKR